MVIVMEMETGKTEALGVADAAESEFGIFADEVLDAGWLPPVEPQLAVHEAPQRPRATKLDPEDFLRALYRNQE